MDEKYCSICNEDFEINPYFSYVKGHIYFYNKFGDTYLVNTGINDIDYYIINETEFNKYFIEVR